MSERMKFIYEVYDQAEVDHFLNTFCRDMVTAIAQESVQMKTRFEAGDKEKDTDEVAEKIMYSMVDEVGDRIKAEVRSRVALGRTPR